MLIPAFMLGAAFVARSRPMRLAIEARRRRDVPAPPWPHGAPQIQTQNTSGLCVAVLRLSLRSRIPWDIVVCFAKALIGAARWPRAPSPLCCLMAWLRCSVPLPLGGTALSRTSLRSCLVPTPSAQRAAAASPGSRGVACLLFFPSYRDMLAVKGLTRHKAIRVVAGDPLLFYSTFPLSAVRDPVQVKQAITPCLFTSRRFP